MGKNPKINSSTGCIKDKPVGKIPKINSSTRYLYSAEESSAITVVYTCTGLNDIDGHWVILGYFDPPPNEKKILTPPPSDPWGV